MGSINLSDLGVAQLRLMHRASDFLDAMAVRGDDVASHPECHLNSWAKAPGHARLRRLAFGWREEPKRLVAYAKDVLGRFRLSGFEVAGFDGGQSGFDTLLVSWARAADFDAAGIYSDRYTRLSSLETPRTLWFLIWLDESLPSELPRNLRIFHRPTSARRMGLGTVGLRVQPAARGSVPRLSGVAAHAQAVASAVQEQLRGGRFRRVLMPYEAQPFQHAVNLAVKAHDPGITTVGYLHALSALPTDLIYRAGAPDRLFVHGVGYKEILLRHLGWPQDRVKVIPSLRYRTGDAALLSGRILLPYALEDEGLLLSAVEGYLRESPVASMPRWQVRSHPVAATSRRHAAFAARLEALCERYSRQMSAVAVHGQTLIVGATAAVIEALERGLNVVHVCANPLFETQTSAIWTYLDVEALGQHVYRYRLREPGRYIAFGSADEPAAAHLGIG